VVDRGEPELIKAMDEGSISPNLAEKVAERPASDQRRIALADSPKAEVKKINRAKKLEKLAESTAAAAKELGTKQYAVIYADPPWRFEPYSRETGMDRSADNHYQTMTTAEIADLDVPGAEHKDCILLLWATAPMLEDAFDVMRSWGFDYKSCAVWVKPKAGTGYWFRNRHELLLLGTRGSPPLPETASPSVFEAEAGRHSEKPAEVRGWIDKTWPALPKLEMFARKSAPGWDSWGNEND
jgi:N6-adenosine-specific RNA methylase IME4